MTDFCKIVRNIRYENQHAFNLDFKHARKFRNYFEEHREISTYIVILSSVKNYIYNYIIIKLRIFLYSKMYRAIILKCFHS